MKIRTSELSDMTLDWAAAKAEGYELVKDAVLAGCVMRGWWVLGMHADPNQWEMLGAGNARWAESWAQAGPIIERELIDLNYDIHWIRDLLDPEDNGDRWFASKAGQDEQGCYGLTPLIAAMRCFVASKLGDEVDVPEELL